MLYIATVINKKQNMLEAIGVDSNDRVGTRITILKSIIEGFESGTKEVCTMDITGKYPKKSSYTQKQLPGLRDELQWLEKLRAGETSLARESAGADDSIKNPAIALNELIKNILGTCNCPECMPVTKQRIGTVEKREAIEGVEEKNLTPAGSRIEAKKDLKEVGKLIKNVDADYGTEDPIIASAVGEQRGMNRTRNMSFREADAQLGLSRPVRRDEWDDGDFIYRSTGLVVSVDDIEGFLTMPEIVKQIIQSRDKFQNGNNGTLNIKSALFLTTIDGEIYPYKPTKKDLKANDWCLY